MFLLTQKGILVILYFIRLPKGNIMSNSYMSSWTVAQAKRDFALGLLRSFTIEAVPMLPGSWCVVIMGPANTNGPLVDVRTKAHRVFKTLDAAVGALVEIGFRVTALNKG